jgi:two-component system CheB/CheR fusion protein
MPKKKASAGSSAIRKRTAKTSKPSAQHDDSFDSGVSELTGIHVAAIGASAGGLEAIGDLLKHLPSNTGMAFVVVQHLDPEHPSLLPELLSRHTRMPVSPVKNNMPVEANHVYVIPPNTRMSIDDGRLLLSPRDTSRPNLPIDFFFRSLARRKKTNAIGILLSGTASDGTLGMEAIKAEGGITFAQDEASAKYVHMPRNAVAAGCVDVVANPEGIAKQLARIAQHRYTPPDSTAFEAPPDEQEDIGAVLKLVRSATGVDFGEYKPATVRRRIARHMMIKHVDSVEKYYRLLKSHPDEVGALYQDLLIRVTEFFREAATFDVLKKRIFPGIVKARTGADRIRIWVPGCSTGEEAYSIAICLLECLDKMSMNVPIQIFGTDVSEGSIEKARAGLYPQDAVESNVSPDRLRRFFSRVERGYRVNNAVRELCIFARQNLVVDPPFSHVDLVSCRNVLIYMGPALQKRAMEIFYYSLRPKGFLLLGNSEGLTSHTDLFAPADKKHKIFTRRKSTAPPALYLPPRFEQPKPALYSSAHARAEQDWNAGETQREADRMVLEFFSPAGVVVHEDGTIVQFRGETGNYLTPAAGQASLNIFKMAREGLITDLRAAIQRALKTRSAVQRLNVKVKSDGSFRNIHLRVIPLKRENRNGRYLMVLFEDSPLHPAPSSRKIADVKTKDGKETQGSVRLRQELMSTRLFLQSVIEEREAANEELKSANEEIQSSNEELQSTNEELETAKEELQSTNEELNTLNEELRTRNAELTQLNDDLINLLSSVNIPIVMLSQDVRVRRFTPMAQKVLNLIPTDVGRPMRDLKPNINVPDLDQIFVECINTLAVIEREVQDLNGTWYLLRIRPYRTTDNKIDGLVMALFEVDALKRSLEQARAARELAEAIIETVHEPLVVIDDKLQVKSANRSFYQTFRLSREETEGCFLHHLDHGNWDFPELHAFVREMTANGARAQDVEIDHEFIGLGRRSLLLSARAVQSGEPMVLLVIADITERRQAAEARYRRLFESARDAILVVDGESGRVNDLNPFAAQWLGYSRSELIGKKLWTTPAFIHTEIGESAIREILAAGSARFDRVTLKANDGREMESEIIGNAYADGATKLIQFNIRDVTERSKTEQQTRGSLKEKEVLLQELHHRVKNNLQVITSLLSLQAHYIDDFKILRMYDETLNRVKSIAAVHELLYQQTGTSMMDLGNYIRKLAGGLFDFYGVKKDKIKLKVNAGDLPLTLDKAVPCGLIINELVSNSLKHAFPESRKGELTVTLNFDGSKYVLAVADNGIGFLEQQMDQSKTLGLQLVKILAEQLGGAITLHRADPTEVIIEFPASLKNG